MEDVNTATSTAERRNRAAVRSYGDVHRTGSAQRAAEFAPLVRRIAHHMAARLPASVDIDDLVQAGMVGLLDALSRYDECHGARFETYATQRIRGAILDELRELDWVPRAVRKNMRRIEQAVATLEQRLGRAPTEQEIAAELGMSHAQYQQVLQEARGHQLVYYEDFAEPGEDHFLDRHGVAGGEDPLSVVLDSGQRRELVRAIEDLPEREKLVLGLYYEKELNLREIGAVMGVSESRVCQLHTQAIARLRARLR